MITTDLSYDGTQRITHLRVLTAYGSTGKERDAESGLDYFGARYYGSNMGRFMSPDPSGLYYATPANPQSLNLYSYGQNNPLTNTDPTGMDCVHINNDTGAFEGFERGDCDNSTAEKANSGYYFDGRVTNLGTTTGDLSGQVVGFGGQLDGISSYTYDSNPAGVSASQGSQQGNDINPFGLGVIQQIGRQTGPTYLLADAFAGQVLTEAGCGAVGIGAGFKSFIGTGDAVMGSPYPGNSKMLRDTAKNGNIQNAEAAAVTATMVASHIANPIVSRVAEYAIPFVGEGIAYFQGVLALSDGYDTYRSCLGR